MVRRKGVTIVEILVTALLITACLAPLLGTVGRQNVQARWARDRIMAEQIAAEVIEHLQHQGYLWMRNNCWLGAATGLGGAGNSVRMDTVVGSGYYVNAGYPNWNNHTSPNAVNPAISGPDPGDPNVWGNLSFGLSIDGAAMTNARDTFTRLGFNRRVEIIGGNNFNPGLGPISNVDAYMVRVTVWTPNGTMPMPSPSTPDGRYQVVTFIGRR